MKLFLFLCIETALIEAKKTGLRIFQGQYVKNGTYAFVTRIETEDSSAICTGSLVSDKWVLTAGHCCVEYVHHIRSTKINDRKTSSKIIERFPHPNYQVTRDVDTINMFKNDIGLLLVESVVLEEYGKISGVEHSSMIGLPVEVLGFGLRSFKPKVNTNRMSNLQIAYGMVSVCLYGADPICIRPKCSIRQRSMPGDSGGPMLYDGKIAGVASTSEVESNTIEDVATFWPVSPYLGWIHDTIKANKH